MLAIIDGDVLAYKACPPRWTKQDEKYVVELGADGKTRAMEYTEEEDRKYMEMSWKNFKKIVTDVNETVFPHDFIMAVKSGYNYRDDIYDEYKGHRKSARKPNPVGPFVSEIRKRAIEEGLAIEAWGREADDLIRIWAEQAKEAGDPFIICSMDKDLKCIPGNHYIIYPKKGIHEGEFFESTEEYAQRFFMEQMLKGDATDNIPGLPGIGPVSAERILADCQSIEEMQFMVCELYREHFGDDWKNQLLSNGKMLYLQKHEHDFFTLDGWVTE